MMNGFEPARSTHAGASSSADRGAHHPKDDGRNGRTTPPEYAHHPGAARLAQDTRIANFKTPLGENVLVLARFDGSEGLGELFEYRIEALSTKELGDSDSTARSDATAP